MQINWHHQQGLVLKMVCKVHFYTVGVVVHKIFESLLAYSGKLLAENAFFFTIFPGQPDV